MSVFVVILVRIFPVFSGIRTEYREILRIPPYSVGMRENAGKMRNRITPNMDSFYTVLAFKIFVANFSTTSFLLLGLLGKMFEAFLILFDVVLLCLNFDVDGSLLLIGFRWLISLVDFLVIILLLEHLSQPTPFPFYATCKVSFQMLAVLIALHFM